MRRASSIRLRMADGTQTGAEVAELGVQVGPFPYRFRCQFVVVDAQHSVLGRNILNLLVVTFGGPSHHWSA